MIKRLDALTGHLESNRNSRTLISLFVMAAILAYLLMATWYKCGDLIIDTSRELWVPLQILNGKVLYNDLYYFHGPLPAYSMAFLFKIFGANLNVLIGCGIVITLLVCFCVYKVSRFFLPESAAVVVVANFCFVFAFGVNIYVTIANYILPYSFASTFCILFIIVALYYFLKYIESERGGYLTGWLIFLTLASLARPDTALSVWGAFVVSGLLVRNGGYKARLIMLLSPLALSLAIYCIALYVMQAFGGFKETLLDSMLFALRGKDSFTVTAAGFDDIANKMLLIGKSFLYHLLALAGVSSGAQLITRSVTGGGKKLIQLTSGVTVLVVTIALAAIFIGYQADLQYRCLPLIILISLVLSAVKMLRGDDYKKNHKLFTLSIVSLMLASKIFLNARMSPYGFYLLTVGLIVYYIYFFNLMAVINRKCFQATSGRLHYVSLLLMFIALFMTSWGVSANIYANKILEVDSGKGVVRSFNDERSIAYWDTVNYLKKNSLENESLVVFPEGASINFYSGRTNPLKYYFFLQGDLEKIGDNTLINQLYENRVNYIAIVHGARDTFGIGYGTTLLSWIYENYEHVEQFGETPYGDDQFWIQILKRKLSLSGQ